MEPYNHREKRRIKRLFKLSITKLDIWSVNLVIKDKKGRELVTSAGE